MGDHRTARDPRRRSRGALFHSMESRASRRPDANAGVAARGAATSRQVADDGRITRLLVMVGDLGNAGALSSTPTRNRCCSLKWPHGLTTLPLLDVRRARGIFWRAN